MLVGEPTFFIIMVRRFKRTRTGELVKDSRSLKLGEEVVINGMEYRPLAGSAHLGSTLQAGTLKSFCYLLRVANNDLYTQYAFNFFFLHAHTF